MSWVFKKTGTVNDNDVNDNVDAKMMDIDNTSPTPTAPTTPQHTITELFAHVSAELLEKATLLTKSGHLMKCMNEILDMMKRKKKELDIDMFIEKDSKEYDAMVNVLLQSKMTVDDAQKALVNLKAILDSM